MIVSNSNHYRHANYRHTKIIATIGPATQSNEGIARLINQGVDVFRLNMAHGSGEWAAELIARVRQVSNEVGRQVAIMMDVKGPEIRTGVVDSPIELSVGGQLRFLITPDAKVASAVPSVTVNYPDLARDVKVGATILIDSGLIRLKILSTDVESVLCEVLTPGVLSSRRHINLPGVTVNLPAVTEKDIADLKFGVEAGIDFVALSFVRSADDVQTLRGILKGMKSDARIIAKIEDQAGVRNMEEIIREADALMIARGDLGIEIDYFKLPLIQTELIAACKIEGKPVIIATHLLESMIESPMPTRAEVSDVSNAVREQADAVMLSGETTTGAYPFESVEVMKNIVKTIEPTVSRSLNSRLTLTEPKSKMLRSAAVLGQELGESGIIVFTRSGFLGYMLAALRPRGLPIYAFTDVKTTFNQLCLPWGVEPFLMDFSDDPEQTIANAIERLRQSNWVTPGSSLVVITNVLAHGKIIDAMQLRQVD
jgi:pyruvate kinase